MSLNIKAFFDEQTFTVSYLVWDGATRAAAIIDPVLDYDPKSGRTSTRSAEALLAAARQADLKLDWILETHAHADHLSAGAWLRERTKARIVIGEHITQVQKTFKALFNVPSQSVDGSDFDQLVSDGDRLKLGNLSIEVIHTPGHTPACVSYRIDDAVFVGDTLFMPDYGTARADFPGGDARTLYRSIRKLLALPPETRLFMCHDYKAPGRDDYAWETTVAAEREANVHVRDAITEDEFVRNRTARDRTLAMPVLIMPSVQVNIRAGELPPPESNGVSYLKIPLNAV
jgi:glyoxylase-like metal-dependent hydrolase (beta-lactamase superfamily II)